MLAEGRMDDINGMNWLDTPVHGKGDHYLYLDHPDMTDLHRAAAIPRPLDETLFLKIGEVLVHGGERGKVQAFSDFIEAWTIPFFLNESI
jgi:hypothetical protein